jgi:hypothetical protein
VLQSLEVETFPEASHPAWAYLLVEGSSLVHLQDHLARQESWVGMVSRWVAWGKAAWVDRHDRLLLSTCQWCCYEILIYLRCGIGGMPGIPGKGGIPGIPNGGIGGIPRPPGGIPPGGKGGNPGGNPAGGPGMDAGFCNWNIGLACPASSYELVMESITLWAFSCPISVLFISFVDERYGEVQLTLVVVDNVSQVISSRIVGLADGHGIVCEIYITVIA